MKKLVLVVLVAFLAGCASTTFVPPVECEKGDSLILKTFPDPRGLDKGLLVVQLAAIEQLPGYTPADAVKVLDDVERRLGQVGGMTYAELVGVIMTKLDIANSLAGGLVFIVGPDIGLLSHNIPISPCDLALVRKHLAKQRALVAIAGAGK